MDAAEVLADQFAKGEQVPGQGSMDCSAVAVQGFSTACVLDVKRKLTPIQFIFELSRFSSRGLIHSFGACQAVFGISRSLASSLQENTSAIRN